MNHKAISIFIWTGGILLLVTGAAKIVSSFGTAPILDHVDPLFLIRFRDSFRVFGIIEAVAAAVCFLPVSRQPRALVITLLASIFLVYRIGVYLLGYHNSCPCFGTLSDALGVSPEITDRVLKIVLAYLLIGGYWALFRLLRSGEKPGQFHFQAAE